MNAEELGIYYIVEFNWPHEITPTMMKASATLHKVVEEADWIEELVAGYGGVGEGKACIWIFRVNDYEQLSKVLNPKFQEENEVTKTYSEFFGMMVDVSTRIKHQVLFG